jgi:hypothetical protein
MDKTTVEKVLGAVGGEERRREWKRVGGFVEDQAGVDAWDERGAHSARCSPSSSVSLF